MINKWLLKERLKELRKKNPLIHHITNNVVANITANLTLAIGASPIMAGAIEEVEDIVKIADVLLLNMGTLTENQLDAMLKAALYAKKHNKKVIFDPVGVGASHFRRKAADRILSEGLIDVVKGNYSEMLILAGRDALMKGVDSVNYDKELMSEALIEFSNKFNLVSAATSEVDIVTDGERIEYIKGGNLFLKKITGTGCMATASIACFLSVVDRFDATVTGLYLMKFVTENIKATGPASFYVAFIDKLYNIS